MKNSHDRKSQARLSRHRKHKIEELDARAEMVCFRGQTLALLRHFFEISSQAGRLPSLIGREFFRAKVSHHAIPSFEEQIVFIRDMEICLLRLSAEHAEMIALVGLYDLSRDEIAEVMRHNRCWVNERVAAAADALSEIFLEMGILQEWNPDRKQRQPIRVRPRGKFLPPGYEFSTELQSASQQGQATMLAC